MNKPLLKKLILNALKDYKDYLDSEGCNDLGKDDPLLNEVNEDERKQLCKDYTKYADDDPAEVAEHILFDEGEDVLDHAYNADFVDMLIAEFSK